ncbi:hypothetical protein AB1Y20_015375 [Prymnesium parvum]|uniref:C3H1-type domain-containing protein n=1 Tax=Prymnesium parvum TaxID=97485 RepID=A0AB34K004_PRYPA
MHPHAISMESFSLTDLSLGLPSFARKSLSFQAAPLLTSPNESRDDCNDETGHMSLGDRTTALDAMKWPPCPPDDIWSCETSPQAVHPADLACMHAFSNAGMNNEHKAQEEHFLGKALTDELDVFPALRNTCRMGADLASGSSMAASFCCMHAHTSHQAPVAPIRTHDFITCHEIQAANISSQTLYAAAPVPQCRMPPQPPAAPQLRQSMHVHACGSSGHLTPPHLPAAMPSSFVSTTASLAQVEQYPSFLVPPSLPPVSLAEQLLAKAPSPGDISQFLHPTASSSTNHFPQGFSDTASPSSPKSVIPVDTYRQPPAPPPLPSFALSPQSSMSLALPPGPFRSTPSTAFSYSPGEGIKRPSSRPPCQPCSPSLKIERASLIDQSPNVPDAVRSRLLDATKFRSVQCRSVELGMPCSYNVCNYYHSRAEKQEPLDVGKIGEIAKELNGLYSRSQRPTASRRRETMDALDYALVNQAVLNCLGHVAGSKWWKNSLFAIDLRRRLERS